MLYCIILLCCFLLCSILFCSVLFRSIASSNPACWILTAGIFKILKFWLQIQKVQIKVINKPLLTQNTIPPLILYILPSSATLSLRREWLIRLYSRGCTQSSPQARGRQHLEVPVQGKKWRRFWAHGAELSHRSCQTSHGQSYSRDTPRDVQPFIEGKDLPNSWCHEGL